MKRPEPALPPYTPTEEDMRIRFELNDALIEVANLPEADRWSLLFESLSDEWLCYVLRSRNLGEVLLLERLMPLVAPLMRALDTRGHTSGDVSNGLMITLQSLILSCTSELERRNLHFCISVGTVLNPFFFFGEPKSIFQPKEPETFDILTLVEYYTNFCDAAE